MRSPRHQSVAVPMPADTVFQSALGVAQSAKGVQLLAVHVGGRKLVLREKSMMSNPKLVQVWVEEQDSQSQLNVAVGSDPRTPKAMMDGKANEKSLKKYLDKVRGALDGSAPAPATPVANFYLAKKTEVPWEDPSQDPQIELDGNLLALYGL